MRIINIYLENYRIHKEIFVEFDKGVNLLLGSNGKGKSSILEAIGITLFSSTFRDGTSRGQQQCIKYGEKEALIKIEFLANDGEIYIVENQIKKSGGFNKLYLKSDQSEKLTAKEEISEKLKVLVGISGELKDIYENIIVAKQNEFINSFKLTATKRQEVFDKIFNTNIYRDIYNGYSKKAFDKYNNTYEKDFSFMEGLKHNIEDIGFLKEEIKKNKLDFDNNNKIKETKINEEKTLKNEIQEINGLKNSFEVKNKDILGIKNLIKSKTEELLKTKEDITKAEEAEKIINENLVNYENYKILEQNEIAQNVLCETLEIKVKELNKNEILHRELINSLEQINSTINNGSLQLSNENEKSLELSNEITKLTLEKDKKDKDFRLFNESVEVSEKLLREFNILDEEKDKIKVLSNNKNLLLQNKQNELSIKNADFNLKNESDLLNKIENLKNLEIEKKDKEKTQNILESRIKDNRLAMEQLESSMCPYLKETCKNLEGKNISAFFRTNEEQFNKELLEVSKKIEVLNKNLINLKQTEIELINYKKLKEEIEKKNREIEKENLELTILEKDLQLKSLVLNSFIEKNGNKDAIQELITKQKTNLNLLKMEETLKNIKEKSSSFEEINKKIKKLDENLKKNLTKKSEEEFKIMKILEVLEDLKIYPLKYDEEKSKLNKIKEEKSSLSSSYNLYVSYKKTAQNLESLEKSKKNIEKTLSEFSDDLTIKNMELKILESELCKKENLNILLEKEKTIKEFLSELNKKIGSIENLLKNLKERIEKNENDYRLIKSLELNLKKLQDKINLTKKFRDNIKDMGTKVSQGMLQEISFWATDNFRKITGRAESVFWSNLENSYEVSLAGDKNITFEQLSGGEQVAVAISIRGAMTNLFTKTKFSIFDEPTNNLDMEKRKSLADNIGEILKDLDQSIIVTHDDSFREMAQKVIEL